MSRRPLRWAFQIIETLVLTVIIFLVIQNFVAQPYRVEQQSMQRTLEQGQYVLVDKLTPRFDPYSRGDIVVFQPPGDTQRAQVPFIKRVIGVPGDTVEIQNGGVLVNGQPLDESGYVFDHQPTRRTSDRAKFVVQGDQLFVMGDHRGNSTDSRAFGPISTTSVIGRAWLRYWPLATLKVLPTPTYANVGDEPAGAAVSP